MMEERAPHMHPSTVLLGLTAGATLCLPKSIPPKRAKLSHTQVDHPNIAYTDAHYYCKEKTGITETGQGEKRALAAHFLVNDAGKQGKIQAEDKHGDIYQHVCFKENAEGMKHKISEHHPESAGRIKLFHVLAIFIGAQSTRYSKEDDAAYRRQQDTGKSDHQHYNCRNNSFLQLLSFFLSGYKKFFNFF